jgi:hypothetical protein
MSEVAASSCVPTLLVRSTVKAATLAARQAAAAGLVSINVAALTEGVAMAMLLSKFKTLTIVLVVLVTLAFGGGLALTHATAKSQQPEKANAPPMLLPAAAPRISVKKEVVFVIETKLVELEPDGRSRILTRPRISALENHVAEVDINTGTASLSWHLSGAGSVLRLGTHFEVKVQRIDATKAQIDLLLSSWKVEKAEKDDTLIVGNGARAEKQVDLGKPFKIVISHDREGKPQLWFELTVSEAEVQLAPR